MCINQHWCSAATCFVAGIVGWTSTWHLLPWEMLSAEFNLLILLGGGGGGNQNLFWHCFLFLKYPSSLQHLDNIFALLASFQKLFTNKNLIVSTSSVYLGHCLRIFFLINNLLKCKPFSLGSPQFIATRLTLEDQYDLSIQGQRLGHIKSSIIKPYLLHHLYGPTCCCCLSELL